MDEATVYHLFARDYDPTLGRFLQTDPAGGSGGANLYTYAQNDPVNLTDPFGYDSTGVTGVTVTAARFFHGGLAVTVATKPSFNPNQSQFDPRPPAPPKVRNAAGRSCSQAVLNVANAAAQFGEGMNRGGNAMQLTAGAMAIAGAPIAATGVGAPVAAGDEITAGAVFAFGEGAKFYASMLTVSANTVARIETGTTSGSGADILNALGNLIPGEGGIVGSVAQDRATDAAVDSLNVQKPPAHCR